MTDRKLPVIYAVQNTVTGELVDVSTEHSDCAMMAEALPLSCPGQSFIIIAYPPPPLQCRECRFWQPTEVWDADKCSHNFGLKQPDTAGSSLCSYAEPRKSEGAASVIECVPRAQANEATEQSIALLRALALLREFRALVADRQRYVLYGPRHLAALDWEVAEFLDDYDTDPRESDGENG